MLCRLCRRREAQVRVTTDEGSAELCETCYKRYRILEAMGEIDGLMEYFYTYDEFNPLSAYFSRNAEVICPCCGTTMSRLINDYKFGCSKCYDFFSEKAKEYFAELGGQEYKGKYFGYESKKRGRRLSEMTAEDLPFLIGKMQEARDNGLLSRAEAIEKRIQQIKGGK